MSPQGSYNVYRGKYGANVIYFGGGVVVKARLAKIPPPVAFTVTVS
jgi:hypothetical protein